MASSVPIPADKSKLVQRRLGVGPSQLQNSPVAVKRFSEPRAPRAPPRRFARPVTARFLRSAAVLRFRVPPRRSAAERLEPEDGVDSDAEVTDPDADDRLAAGPVTETDVFEVRDSGAEPIALDKQSLPAKSVRSAPAGAARSSGSCGRQTPNR